MLKPRAPLDTTEQLLESGLSTTVPYRPQLVLTRGQGARVWDTDGREYLDFLAGIAVNILGHCHPVFVERVGAQLERLLQVSNLFFNEPQIRLQAELVGRTFADRVYLCNSGAEANEAALKLARRYHSKVIGRPRPGFIAMKDSFHGRTLGALSATGQPKYHEGFEPLIPGFAYATFNDLESVKAIIGPETAAVIVEPVQGEGGVIPATPDFLQGLETLCREEGALLILDEVQTGLGRTGTFLAHEQYEVTPDVVTMAKGLGGGLPIGAMLCTEQVAPGLVPGTHATTFGGNPVVAAAALAVLEILDSEQLLSRARTVGEQLRTGLEDLATRHRSLGEVRGLGMMLAVTYDGDTKPVVAASRAEGLLHNAAGGRALRFLPPLILTSDEVDTGLGRLDRALLRVARGG